MLIFKRSCSIFWKLNRIAVLSCFSVTIVFSLSALIPTVEGKKCPGKCIYNVTDCKANGGKVAGYCTNELACCDYSYKKMGGCGSKMSKLTTAIFRSPDYPENSHGDLVCPFEFVLESNATEFSDVLMDGMGFVKHSSCESDMFYMKGFPNWTPPPQCGNLTNYVAVIDLGSRLTKGMKTLTILALMSSNKYKWSIKVTQLSHKAIVKKISDSTTTTEAPPPKSSDDDDEEDSSSEQGSYDHRPRKNKKIEQEQFIDNNEESEQDEMFRIMQVTANNPKIPRLSTAEAETLMISGDESQENVNYPEEETFIVNGDDTQISNVPWQASLRNLVSPRMAKHLPRLKLKNCTLEEGLHFCGGSIISDLHILSASHCFLLGEKLSTWQRTSSMKIVLGDSHLCDENMDGVQEFRVDKVYYHYAYDNSAIMNDVVVIKLNKKIKFTSKIQPVKLAEEGMQFEHQIALASGWGLTNLTTEDKASKSPEQLQSADDMFIGNNSYCMQEQLRLYSKIKSQSLIKYPKYADMFSSLLCTYIRNGSLARVVGQGDSGGPLVVNVPVENNKRDKSSHNGNSNHNGNTNHNANSNYNSNNNYDNGKSINKGKSVGSSGKTEPLLVGVISYMIPIPHEDKVHDVSNYVDFYQSVPFYRRWIDLAMQ